MLPFMYGYKTVALGLHASSRLYLQPVQPCARLGNAVVDLHDGIQVVNETVCLIQAEELDLGRHQGRRERVSSL
jgi:hypothetical protein